LTPHSPRRRSLAVELGAACALVLVVLLVFRQTLSFDFVMWDDDHNIYQNPHIQALGWSQLAWMFTDTVYVRIYMPLGWLSLAVIHGLVGLDPRGYHLANLLVHAGNTLLVFFLIRRLLTLHVRGETAGPATAVTAASFVATLAWAVHPLRADVVARASDLFHGQAGLFMLAALSCYVHAAARATGPLFRRRAYWLAVLFYVASLLTYPTGVTAFFVFFLLDVWPLRRPLLPTGEAGRPHRRVWLEKAPFVSASAAVLLLNAWGRTHTTFIHAPTLAEFGLLDRVMQAFWVWAYYAWKPWWPFGLSPVYTRLVSFSPTSWPFLASAAAVLALTTFAVVAWRRFPALSGTWLCHLALLVPFLGLTEHYHFTSDRYSYLVSVAWSVLLALVLLRLWTGGRPTWVKAAALAVTLTTVAGLGVLAHRQAFIWRNTATLFTYTLRQIGSHPYAADIWWRLGLFQAQQGRISEAIASFDRTLAVLPDDPRTLVLKGATQAAAGDLGAAAATLRRAVAVAPGNDDARALLAAVEARRREESGAGRK
jgi:hypothetical protein